MPDALLTAADSALRTLFAQPHAGAPSPATGQADDALGAAERKLSGALMRVNHVGEVCAQALYTAQALATRNPALRVQFEAAAAEETDHLAWTRQRLQQLGAAPSVLNPLWYAGAFALGLVAGRAGDAVSLGFVVETERQVTEHLESHLNRLPPADTASRAVVARMRDDEQRHAAQAETAGARPLPAAVRGLMRAAARVMTTVAHRV